MTDHISESFKLIHSWPVFTLSYTVFWWGTVQLVHYGIRWGQPFRFIVWDNRSGCVGLWIQVDKRLKWFGTKVRIHGVISTGYMHYVIIIDIYNPEYKSRAASSDITRLSAASTNRSEYISSTPPLPSHSHC